MIRNLKILMLAAMALAALGAVNASGASAAGEQFHCEVDAGKFCKVTVDPDGSGKNSHHIFIVKKGAASGALTCNSLTGTATAERTANTLTLGNLVYGTCELAGAPVTIATTGCHYLFNSEGGKVSVVCEAGKNITITSGGCVVTIGGQALSGITYTNLNSEREVTISALVKNVSGNAGPNCASKLGFTGPFTEGEYTTGNTITTAFRDDSGAEGPRVNNWWT